jgi:pseudouridine-5'-phosphate glycosidase
LWIARRAGIGVFATGGIGGVHREWGDTPDVSADLEELARADGQVVVCSGAKSILDLPATWERLESLGIPVIGFATDEFPAFWTRSSGLPLDSRVEEPEEAAEIIRAHRRLGLPGALLLVQPVPEKVEIPAARAHHAIELALEEARELEIRGKAVTPFLLRAVRQRLGDAAGIANQALLVENARLAGRLAVLLAERSR